MTIAQTKAARRKNRQRYSGSAGHHLTVAEAVERERARAEKQAAASRKKKK